MHHLKNILCPVDFSDHSRTSLAQGVKLASLYQAKLTILHVVPKLPGVFAGIYGLSLSKMIDMESLINQVNEKLDEWIGELVPNAIQTEKMIREGSVSEEITRAATDCKADLVIMASEGNSSLLGTHTSKVIRNIPCPLLTLNDFKPNISFKKILIPVERKFGIRELRRYVKSYFSIMDPEIHLLSVISPNADESDTRDELKFLSHEIEYFAKDGITKVTTEVAHSASPAGEILLSAGTGNFDLVMLNTHGRSGLGRLVTGSVTETVVIASKIPVMVIRPGREELDNFNYHTWLPYID